MNGGAVTGMDTGRKLVPAAPEAKGVEEERLRLAARHLAENRFQSDFLIASMHCAGCMRRIETALRRLPYVHSARANLSTKRVSVEWDGLAGKAGGLVDALRAAGFEAVPFDLEVQASESDASGRQLLLATGVAGFAAANIMLLSVSVWSGADAATAQLFHLISGLIAVPAVGFAGQPFFRSAIAALNARRLNMDVPISLAVLLSLGMSLYESLTGGAEAYFDAAVTLLFFLLIGRYLDHAMREKARGAVTRLSAMSPKGATVIDAQGGTAHLPLGEIAAGMRVLVKAGERIPLDGVIVKGASELDRSLVTGESGTVTAAAGMPVEGGVLNLSGPIELKVTKPQDQSFLAEVIALMETAEQGKARYVRIADRLVQIYAPLVHLLAFTAFIGWMLASGGDWHHSLFVATAVLIVTCPCALGLAVPIVHVIAAGRLFREGIMVKDGSAFERLSEIDTVIFDKTGTLTTGEPEVVAYCGGNGDELNLAGLLAQQSNHPAARAIAGYRARPTPVPERFDAIGEVPGFGVEAMLDGRPVRLGRRKWVEEIAVASQGNFSLGNSDVAFARAGGPILDFLIKDSLRPDALATVDQLKKDGIAMEILSGDGAQAVRDTAQILGIDTYAHSQTPHEKIHHIDALSSSLRRILVVGDGLNDAPALAAAHVSMAPSSGSDVGKLASDLVFTGQSLQAVALARAIALRTDRLVRQNFALAILYNMIAVPLALFGHVTPLVAAIAMSASSIAVVANSMRLNFDAGWLKSLAGKATAANIQPVPRAAR